MLIAVSFGLSTLVILQVAARTPAQSLPQAALRLRPDFGRLCARRSG